MYGLVLEGGGGKGSYHIGACKALNEMGIEIGAVAGTSVGALNGAMYVQGDIHRAYDIWCNLNPASVFNVSGEELDIFENIGLKISFNKDKLSRLLKRLGERVSEHGLDVQPLVDLVKQNVDEEKIRKSPIEFGLVTVDLTGRQAVEIYKEDIPEGKMADYILASASFPAFKPAVIDGRVFIDGGFYNTLPIDMVSRKGYKDIIVVRTFAPGIRKRIDPSGLNLINIEPAESLGPMLDFNSKRSRKNIVMGYFDAKKVFYKLKGQKYYIEAVNDELYFVNFLLGMEHWKIDKISEILAIEKYQQKERALFEQIIPKLSELLGLDVSHSYEDIVIALAERVAEKQEIERFKIYPYNEFYEQLAGRYLYHEQGFYKEIPAFLISRELIPKKIKNQIIDVIAEIVFDRVS
jgi:NTE family protein